MGASKRISELIVQAYSKICLEEKNQLVFQLSDLEMSWDPLDQ